MNNPIIVTDRALSYYDAKLKEYVGVNYGKDMLIDWEPMEGGKNPFKLKIALKNRYGAELFSKIIDFPLEQTIVSGEYNNGNKSLILYFQDGSYTSIPIEDLIEGLASKLDLEKKADLGERQAIKGNGYTVNAPANSAPFAQINKIGGMTYKVGDTLRDAKVTQVKSVGKNLHNPNTDTLGYYMSQSGTYPNSEAFYTDFIRVKPSTLYTYSDILSYTNFFDADKNRISSIYDKQQITTPSNCYYIVWSGFNNNHENLQVCEGSEAPTDLTYTEHILLIPEDVQSLEGYGQSNPDNINEYNYIDLVNKKFIALGHIVNGVWVAYSSAKNIDIPSIIGVEGGSTLTFENEYGYNVPYEIEYTITSNDVIGAKEFVGDLKGTAEVAKYYDINGSPSTQTIGEALNKLLGAGNPIKITIESIGQLSTTQVLTGISANIISNPPVAINDIILDRYLDGDAAYLCFWVVTDVQGGSTDSTMTLQGAGNIYVGGGSASVAAKAILDGKDRNIADTIDNIISVNSRQDGLISSAVTLADGASSNAQSAINIANEAKSTSSEADSKATSALETANEAKETADGIELIAKEAKELAETASNNADSARKRADRGVQSISATYTSSYYGQGTFKLNVTFVGGTTESFDITDELSGFIMDVFSHNQ